MWVVFILFMIFFYSNNSKKIKKLENKIKKLERKEKGNIEMSRLLQELIGKNPTIVGQVFGTSLWEVVDVDEEWVKLRSVDKEGKEKFKLQRIEDIQTVEFDGEQVCDMQLKNRLKELRDRDGLNQTDLAKLAEVSRQTISLLERDEYTPSVVIALKISQIFNETVESVFRLEEDE